MTTNLRGHKVLLMGSPGAGKTRATATLAGISGKRIIHLLLEPTSLPVLQKTWIELYGKVPENVHWHVFDFKGADLDELEAIAKSMNTLDGDSLAAWKSPFRAKHDGLTRMQQVLKDFPDDRTETKLGKASTWDTNTVLVLDSLTSLCEIVWGQAYGGRIDIEAIEYGKAQGFLEVLFTSICWGWPCNFVATAHVEERAKDRTAMQAKTKDIDWKWFPKLIGGQLRNTFGGYFDEVVLCKRLGASWVWDTQASNADVKQRMLPLSMNIKPDFVELFKVIEALQTKVKEGDS